MKKIIIIIPIVIWAISINFLPSNDTKKNSENYKLSSVYSTYFNNNDDKRCSFCHNDKIKHEIMHAPVLDDCETCHQSTGKTHPRSKSKGFPLAEKTPDLCYICHEPKNDQKNIHAPVKEGVCSSCHLVHGSKYQFLLPKSPTKLVCIKCHDLDLTENSNIHAPIEQDGCQCCHDSHQSDYSYLLIEEKSKLCVSCHENIGKEKQAKYQHASFEDDCSNCHNPHSSKEDHLLNMKSSDLCFTCHDSKLLEKEFSNTATNFRNGNQNLHYLHINGDKGRNCNICHEIHASSNEHLIKEKSIFVSGETFMNYKVTFSGGSCFPGCHGEESYKR